MNLCSVNRSVRPLRPRGGPIHHVLALLLLGPLCSGCWWHRYTRGEYEPGPASEAAAHYYREAVAESAPYQTDVALQIPENPRPLTSRDPEAQEKRELTLREALEIALRNSKVVRQLRGNTASADGLRTGYDAAIAETEIQRALAQFDATLVFNLFWGKDEIQINSNVAPSGGTVGVDAGIPFIFEQDTFGGIAGRNTGLPGSGDILSIRKPFVTGGEATVGFNTDYTFSNVPAGNRAFPAAYDTRFFTTFRQPLLRGSNPDINRATIVVRRLESDITLLEFKRDLAGLVRDVERKYWELYASQIFVQAIDQQIELMSTLLEDLRLKLAVGTAAETDVLEAEAQLFDLRVQRNRAIGAVESSVGTRRRGVLVVERELRRLIGLPPSDGQRLVVIDDPTCGEVQFDWQSIIAEAFANNPDIQQQKLSVAIRREALRAAADRMRPQLDAFIRKEFTGLEGEFDESIREVNHGGFGSVTWGVQFQHTFGYRESSAILRRSQLELDREIELLRERAREVEAELAQHFAALDGIQIECNLLELSKANSERRLRNQTILFQEGKIPIDRLLEAVRSHLTVLEQYTLAHVDYQDAIIRLEFFKGTIFRYNMIHVHEEPWPADAYPQAMRQQEDRARAIEWYHSRPRPAQEPLAVPVYDRPQAIEHSQGTEPGTDDRHDHAVPPAEFAPPRPLQAAQGPREIPLRLNPRDARGDAPGMDVILPAGGTEP